MDKYIVNYVIVGFENLELKDENVKEIKESEVIIVLDDTNEDIVNYYNATKTLIKNNNRVLLINTGKNKVFKPLATLLVAHDCYDIYSLESKEEISANFISRIEEREPNYNEVQTFIGGEVTAYNDVITILYGVENLVENGDVEGLVQFVEKHLPTIENLSEAIDYMKKRADLTNSQELVDELSRIRENLELTQKELIDKEVKLNNIIKDKEKLEVEIAETLDKENKLREEIEDLKEKVKTGGNSIVTYTKINTSSFKCRTQRILYIKEISYVNYTNSLIYNLMDFLHAMKLKVKLVIYDDNTEFYGVYDNKNVVTMLEYKALKESLLKTDSPFVVVEPNPTIITDLIESDEAYHILIVLDKMKRKERIIEGNNVVNMFVLNSYNDYINTSKDLKIGKNDLILTSENSRIPGNIINIPHIEGYKDKGMSDSAKTQKYIKLRTSNGKGPMQEIMEALKIGGITR